MPDSYVSFSTVQNDAAIYIADRMYELAERRMVMGAMCQKYSLPQAMGKTMRLIRARRIALPVSPLTEGTTPSVQSFTLEEVDIPVEQWGMVVGLTDVVDLTVKHPMLQKAIQLSGMAMAEMMERETCETAMSGTNVVFVDSANNNSRDDLAATDIVTSHVILEALTVLQDHGAPAFENGQFRGAFPPQVKNDILDQDETFIGTMQFGNQRALEYAEVGHWAGVDWKWSNFLPIFKGVAAPDTNAATAEKAQAATSGSGGAIDNSLIVVVARDAMTDYERKISQTLTVADTDATFALTLPSSTNYLYDVYMSNTSGGAYKLVAARQAASTVVTVNATLYTNGVLASPPVAPASGVTTFNTFITGQDALCRVELNGMSLQSYITPKGASDSDPLSQRRKVGHKVMFKVAIVDNNYMIRIESGSGFSASLPA